MSLEVFAFMPLMDSNSLAFMSGVVFCCAQLVISWLFRQRSKRGAAPEEKWVFKQLLDLLEKNRSSDSAGQGPKESFKLR